MIPDAKQRLEDGVTDLKALLVFSVHPDDIDLQEAAAGEVTEGKKTEAEEVIKAGELAIQG